MMEKYSDCYLDHLRSPRFMLREESPDFEASGRGRIKGGARDSSLTIWIRLNDDGIFERFAWRARHFPRAVASTSMLAELVMSGTNGRPLAIDAALAITPFDLARALGGFPGHKIHASFLGPAALRLAVDDHLRAQGLDLQASDAEDDALLCHCHTLTVRDVIGAARAGHSFDEIQNKLGIATGCGSCEWQARAIHQMHHNQPPGH